MRDPPALPAGFENNGSRLRFPARRDMVSGMDYTIIRSRRKTAALEITRDCRVLARVPLGMTDSRVEEFVARHEEWLLRHLQAQRQRQSAAPPPPTAEEIAVLKARARAVLPEKVAYWSGRMGLVPTGVKITAARTRYGSCSAKNGLCFSCFLMRSPEEAVDAVVVHELAHIRHKNHGPAFYALVESVLPDYRDRTKRLV